ncbi:hypothetical protein D0962_15380 [Leptolyngbyaceae cyanobacterium CCMR0082]|uniref:Uncharacterized protein n=1 Tax=Adonisia turfae CCMR0082 TaxID=2304604 RepID=A0A6M0S6T2_9CYAN|nr:hypothetical protein [Adonisia turfae]NEZ64155.1 hypothetical protein [Adonisia turfae CCMR0082]
MNKPTIITIPADRDCLGEHSSPVDIEIHSDMIAIDTVPTDPDSPIDGDLVYLSIDDIHAALRNAGHANASPQLNRLLAILNPETLED